LGDKNLTLKLIDAHEAAMSVARAVPTGYGMGKSGWVTLPLDGDLPPLAILCDWIDESYRLIAPKKLIAELDSRLSSTGRTTSETRVRSTGATRPRR